MKKLISGLSILMACLFCLTGCTAVNMRYNTTIEFKFNGKADFFTMAAIEDTESSSEDSESSAFDIEEQINENETVKKLIEEGWKYEPYNQDGFYGVTVVRKDIVISEMGDLLREAQPDLFDESHTWTLEKKGFQYVLDTNIFSFVQDSSNSLAVNMIDNDKGYMTLVIKLPSKAINSNATSVSDDGRTLEWNLLSMNSPNVHVEFRLINITQIVGGVIAVLLLIITAFVVFSTREKKRSL